MSDAGSISDEVKKVLYSIGVEFEENNHDWEIISRCDLIIKSPGIPDKAEIIIKTKKSGIMVISEIEYAARFTKAKLIAITGSNGKTTTASLTYDIFHNAGLNVGLVGNIGVSFAESVATEQRDYYIIELSSFQLDGIVDFHPHIAIILNITPDHLDRYDYQFDKYRDSKFRIAMNQNKEDHLIFCADDKGIMDEIENKKIKAQLHPFSLKEIDGMSGYIENKHLIITTKINTYNMSIYELALQGKHNIYNSMAAGISSRIMELRNNFVRESLSNFQSIEHRLEFVAKVDGIDFINDSKATNVNSTWFALESIGGNVVLILGGEDKGNDYSLIEDLVTEKVDTIICLGKDNAKLMKFFSGKVKNIAETNNVNDAVLMAKMSSKPGSTVLLSPACASFDLFKNYEERGSQFKQAVRSL